MRRPIILVLLLVSGGLCLFTLVAGTPVAHAQDGQSDEGTVFLPLIRRGLGQVAEPSASPTATLATPTATATVGPTATSTPPQTLLWDPRLDARGAWLVKAVVTPGAGYWRLVEARWFNRNESGGQHHILIDIHDAQGDRLADMPVRVTWPDDATRLKTEAKPGEAYAAAFAMYSIAPAYAARPDDGAPADTVHGMGMGEIDDPYHAHHTSYGLIWRWSVAASATPSDSPTPTPSATESPQPTTSPDPSTTPSPSPVSTATPTVMLTPTAIPTVTPTATATTNLLFDRAEYAGCTADTNATRIVGVVYRSRQPADGYRVVFSWQPDGTPATPPSITGPSPPGAYTHIVNGREGDWWVWIVDAQGERISPMAFYRSADGCNIGEVNFYGP
jgi:hypothetical protein